MYDATITRSDTNQHMAIIQRRPIGAGDIERICRHLDQVENHYGDLDNPDRTTLLRQLLKERAISGLMLERLPEPQAATGDPIAIGITGFLSQQVVDNFLTQPLSGPVVDALYDREQHGEKVLLRPADIAINNAGEGLALIFLHFYLPAGDPSSEDTQRALELMQSSFRLHHGGYNCYVALHPVQPETPQGSESMLSMGFQAVGDGRHLLRFNLETLDQVPFHPFNCLRRKRTPRLGLSPAEKELLTLALWGNSDVLISGALHISLDTVRKRWRDIFRKIADHPDINLFPDQDINCPSKTRGPEKRRVVMQFIDAHLEEIRPFAE